MKSTPRPGLAISCRSCQKAYTERTWTYLDLASFRKGEEGGLLELRTCACGATLGLEVFGTLSCRVVAAEAEKLTAEVKRVTIDVKALAEEMMAIANGKDYEGGTT